MLGVNKLVLNRFELMRIVELHFNDWRTKEDQRPGRVVDVRTSRGHDGAISFVFTTQGEPVESAKG